METVENSQQIAFGPFRAHIATGELLNGKIRVRLPGQSFQMLLLLLSRPGELVTREELKDQIWRDGTFVDFEHGLYAAMNRLRRALNDSADSPRYIETVPGRGYRFIGTILRPEASLAPPAKPTSETTLTTGVQPQRSRHRGRLWVIIAVGLAIACFALGWLFHTPGELPARTIVHITGDAGLSDSPGISSDGKLIAYSADNSAGGRDLFVKQANGGSPVRLTFDGLGNTTPDFSPDGSRIVFRSNRGGGGIYDIPVFGGEERLIVRDGWNPKFSPDGSRIAYWVGDDNVATAIPGAGAWVIAASGGQPRRVGTSLTTARYPIWDPNGRQLLVDGYASANNYESSAIDWWLVGVDDPHVIRTGAFSQFNDAGLRSYDPAYESGRGARSTPVMPNMPRPYCWSNMERAVVFSARNVNAETFSLWATRLFWNTGRVSGHPIPITTGASNDLNASCAINDSIAFTNLDYIREIWKFGGDLNASEEFQMASRSNTPGPSLPLGNTVKLQLKEADFTTAARVSAVINRRFNSMAHAENSGLVTVNLPPEYNSRPTEFIAELERLTVEPDRLAKVVINERTGTVILGNEVRIAPVAIMHGNLTVQIQTHLIPVPTGPFNAGPGSVVPEVSVIAKDEKSRNVLLKEGATVEELVKIAGRNRINNSRRDRDFGEPARRRSSRCST